jgi:hypothetical protein
MTDRYARIREALERGADAEAEFIAACDPGIIRELLEERDALRRALVRILENEAPDWKFAEEFGGYVLDDDLREEAHAALAQEAVIATKYRIYMDELIDSKGSIKGGWYGGDSDATMNTYIYWRTPDKKKALTFSRQEAIQLISDARMRGYPCHAEPPIIETF